MCGILGAIALNGIGLKSISSSFSKGLNKMYMRGPDFQKTEILKNVFLGHTRLSIIDTSDAANQPMFSADKRFALIFNGEIFNFPLLRKQLESKGILFQTNSDTEVLLQLLIKDGAEALQELNGFFSFVFYDSHKNEVIIARDRFGQKPLYYYFDENQLLFASQMDAILAFSVEKSIDKTALFTYLQLNYIPQPNTILNEVKKLSPGHYFKFNIDNLNTDTLQETCYYDFRFSQENLFLVNPKNYAEARQKLFYLLEDAVKLRLVSDVPLGTFLSGGIDSSIITSLASRHQENLSSFSISFPEQPYYDESDYALEVAKKAGTKHTIFPVRQKDFDEHLETIIDSFDEPFADASAIAVYILSKLTKQHIKVALSGDGADEMFGGYNKHLAEYKIREISIQNQILKLSSGVLDLLPAGRHSDFLNKLRQLKRYTAGMRLSKKERYWCWASILNLEEANYFLKERFEMSEQKLSDTAHQFIKRRNPFTKHISKDGPLNEILMSDMHLVLPGDMLKKVDSMSMSNSLEVRSPFLDFRVAEFAFTIPSIYKVNGIMTKKILQDTFKDLLPPSIFNRPKKGFEVPLHAFIRGKLRQQIENIWLEKTFIKDQNIFNPDAITILKKEVFSSNPKDSLNTVWALIVFQNWYKKHLA